MSNATFVINGVVFESPLSELTGLQIRALAGVPALSDLVVEGQGHEPDRIVADDEVLHLRDPRTILFSRPQTNFGGHPESYACGT